MKIKTFGIFATLILVIHSTKLLSQATNTQDSLALVDLYNSTSGPNWTNKTNWLSTQPVAKWFGTSTLNGRVVWIFLGHNNLKGSLPPSLGTMSALRDLIVRDNQLTGNIPSAFDGLTQLLILDLSYNQLSGTPPLLTGLSRFTEIILHNNKYTFNGLQPLVNHFTSINYSGQADIPLIENENNLSVNAGGSQSLNTYKWFRDNVLVVTIKGDSNYIKTAQGNYSVIVNNDGTPGLFLHSISKGNDRDSLALVDLYQSTNGSAWLNNSNWLTAPIAIWHGVTIRDGRVVGLRMPYNNLSGPPDPLPPEPDPPVPLPLPEPPELPDPDPPFLVPPD